MLGEGSIRAKFRKSLWKKKSSKPAQPDWDRATGEPPYSQAWGRGSRENAWWRCISPMGPWDPDLGERGLGSLLRLLTRNSARAKVQWIKGQIYQISHFSYFILQTYLRKIISNYRFRINIMEGTLCSNPAAVISSRKWEDSCCLPAANFNNLANVQLNSLSRYRQALF